MEKALSEKLLDGLKKVNKIEQVMDVNEVSRIAQGVAVHGDISSTADIRIDGTLDGTLYSKGRIVVGENASLKGNVLCDETDFWGRLDGDIYVKDTLSLKSSATINGNMHVRRLQVEMGAQINGSCRMITEAEYDESCGKVVKTKIEEPGAPASKKSARQSSESAQ